MINGLARMIHIYFVNGFRVSLFDLCSGRKVFTLTILYIIRVFISRERIHRTRIPCQAEY